MRAACRRWTASCAAERVTLQEGRKGTLTDLPELPKDVDVATTAAYIRDVLAGT
jgi:hypothetical protein